MYLSNTFMRLNISAWTLVLACLVLSCVLYSYASYALNFTTTVVYQEDFNLETAFPTTPEIDTMGSGALVSTPNGGSPPTFTGLGAHYLVSIADIRDGLFVEVDDDQFSTVEANVGLRGTFSGLTFSDEGEARLVQAIRFTLDDDIVLGGTSVASFVQVIQHETFASAVLWILEEHVGPNSPTDDHLDFLTLNLPIATANQLVAGVSFTVDLEVDRTAGTARASLLVGSDPEITTQPLPLMFAQDYSVSSARQYIDHRSNTSMTIELDQHLFELYADPHVYVPLFNLDLGNAWGTPSASYAAAGSPGFWQELVLGANSLSNVDGVATGTTATVMGTALGSENVAGGEIRDLLADWLEDRVGWSVSIANLPIDGAYRVLLYSLGVGPADSGTLFANGDTHPSIPGTGVLALIEGQSYARIDTLVAGGTLDLSATATNPGGVLLPTHLSALQIETTVPLPEPTFGIGLALGAIALVGRRLTQRQSTRQ